MSSELDETQKKSLLKGLMERFEKNPHRHKDITWSQVLQRLESEPTKLAALFYMESTGGEPDVIHRDPTTGKVTFWDLSPESPSGRRSLCYDDAALESRKEAKPRGSVLGDAALNGLQVLNEDQYRQLQTLGEFDKKTSSWILTPEPIRYQGGALFCDRRYNHVFTYHNGAESYYAARGWRGSLDI